MPRNVVNVATVYGIAFILFLSFAWIQLISKKKAMQNYLNSLNSAKTNNIYEKCRWVFVTADVPLIMQTLAHVSYKEHIVCLKKYIEDKRLFDLELKTVILFKTANLYKKNSKKIQFFSILSEEIKQKQLLLKVAAVHCPEIIPSLYSWLKMQDQDYVQKQVSAVYNYAINNNNPLLLDCLLGYDIPLHPNEASEYLKIVLNEQKHTAFVCLLMKAGAKIAPQSLIKTLINNKLLVFQDAKNIVYQNLFSSIYIS